MVSPRAVSFWGRNQPAAHRQEGGEEVWCPHTPEGWKLRGSGGQNPAEPRANAATFIGLPLDFYSSLTRWTTDLKSLLRSGILVPARFECLRMTGSPVAAGCFPWLSHFR